MFKISYDEATGIVRTVAQGSASPGEVESYICRLRACASRARSEKGRLLHLVDASASAVQPRDSFEILARAASEHIEAGDLNAVVMPSQLARMQVALLSTSTSICMFSNLMEAEAWLVAEGQKARTQPSP